MGTAKRWVVVLAMVLALPLPAQAHSKEELDQFREDWIERASEKITWEMVEEFLDMMERHHWYSEWRPPRVSTSSSAPPRSASTGTGMGSGVEQWRALVSAYFPADQVDRALCIMGHESGGNPNAKNPRSSASGLFQLLSTWHDYFGIDPFVPEQNVSAAAQLMALYGWSQWSPYNRGLCR